MEHLLVVTTEELKNTLDRLYPLLEKKPILAIDTEFMRRTSYYSKLCLVQIAVGDIFFCIDVLSPDLCLDVFCDLLKNSAYCKVFYSAFQDIEIFIETYDCEVKNIFDMQLLAKALGYGESLGYGSFVKAILKKNLDKTLKVSAWDQRPLTQEQLLYAQQDVTYLYQLYEVLEQRFCAGDLFSWIQADTEALYCRTRYQKDIYQSWRKVRQNSLKMPQDLVWLQYVCAWREQQAQRCNCVRTNILSDQECIEVAFEKEKIFDSGSCIEEKVFAEDLKAFVKKILDVDPQNYPRLFSPSGLTKDRVWKDIFKILLTVYAKKYTLEASYFGTGQEVEEFIDHPQGHKFLISWRKKIFGDDFYGLLEGKYSLGRLPLERGMCVIKKQ